MAEKDPIVEKVTDLIAEYLGVDRDEVVPRAAFIDDLSADSLDIVELVMALEKEFNVEISDDDAENSDEDAERISTVQDAIDYVRGHSK